MREFKSIIKVNEDEYPIIFSTQILVAGGGPAGIAAAETAARMGKDTILLEQYGFLGGASVAGLSGTLCGMYYASEKESTPKLLVGGMAKRFAEELERRKGLMPPQKYGKTYLRTHDPFKFKVLADEMLKTAGVQILYHTKVCGVVMEGEDFKGLLIDTKSGFGIIKADIIIDATGDADVIHRAGLSTFFGDDGKIQSPTMIFRAFNINTEKFLEYMDGNTIAPHDLTKKIIAANKNGEYKLPREHIWMFDTVNPNEVLCNVTRISGEDGRDLNVTDPIDHTEAEIVGRLQAKEYLRFLKDNIPGFKDAYIMDTGVEVGVRQTRSIVGIKKLKNDDVINCVKTPDGIVKSAWPIELHSGKTPKLEWILDDYYTVPYGALVPEVGENIIVAGRNLCAEHEALASCRVLGQCFGYGQAAAVASVISIDNKIKIRDIDGKDVVEMLNKDGAEL